MTAQTNRREPDGVELSRGAILSWQMVALLAALEENVGQVLVALYSLDTKSLERLVEAAQLIDVQGQDILDPPSSPWS